MSGDMNTIGALTFMKFEDPEERHGFHWVSKQLLTQLLGSEASVKAYWNSHLDHKSYWYFDHAHIQGEVVTWIKVRIRAAYCLVEG